MDLSDLAEYEFGEGAVRFRTKMLLLDRSDNGKDETFVGFIARESLLKGTKSKKFDERMATNSEMWVAEVIIIPRYKFRRNNTEPCWHGMQIQDQLMGYWSLPQNWDEQIFGKQLQPPEQPHD